MLKIDNVKLPIDLDENALKNEVAKISGCKSINDFKILKKSIDARDKNDIFYVYSVAFSTQNEEKLINSNIKVYNQPIDTIDELIKGIKWTGKPPIVVGMGPAGLFLSLSLAKAGAKPIIFERGSAVEKRVEMVNAFTKTLALDTNTNVQFGEGGAGTFSDGKLNTNLNNEFIRVVLNEFVKAGAPCEIFYDAKPHIGTDLLRNVVKNIRETLLSLGASIYFDSQVTDIIVEFGKIKGVRVGGNDIKCDKVFFATGHSARDTYEMLYNSGVKIEQKPFSMGVRIEHKQRDISFAQYGENYKKLPPADYKLVTHLEKRSLYTFCMCPGGKVINASSEKEHLCVNGMSEYKRDAENANSAILVNVEPKDFGSTHPLAGIAFQRKCEHLAYKISNSYHAPVQLLGDFLKGKTSSKIGEITPSIASGYSLCDLRACLPDFVTKAIIEGVPNLGRKLKGFDRYDSVLTGVEARSSSPVRIVRDANYNTNIEGFFAVGEGAGYAGGITSSAIDGLRCALSVLKL